MYIDHISLLDYRTYALLSLPLSAGVTVFLGSNGVGKTNIVEAIDYAASLSSHRVSHDGPLVRAGASRAYIRTRTVRGSQQTVTEFEIAPGQSNRVRINRAAPVRAKEALGIARTVLFSPEDLQLVKGDLRGVVVLWTIWRALCVRWFPGTVASMSGFCGNVIRC